MNRADYWAATLASKAPIPTERQEWVESRLT